MMTAKPWIESPEVRAALLKHAGLDRQDSPIFMGVDAAQPGSDRTVFTIVNEAAAKMGRTQFYGGARSGGKRDAEAWRRAREWLKANPNFDPGTVPYTNTVHEEPRQMKDITAIATVRRVAST